MDELIRKMRQRQPPSWGDLRERRVLGRVEAEIPRRRRRRRVRVSAAISAVAAAAALAAFLVITSDRADRPERRLAAGASGGAKLRTFGIKLPDGSQAFVHDAGQIELKQNEAGALWVRQRRGTVRYEVRPRSRRAFVVQAGVARVRVVGTIFSVTLEREHVVVTVERGKVAVERGEQRALLGAGDKIRISSTKPTAPAPASQPAAVPVAGGKARHPRRRASPTLEELMSQVDAARKRGDLDRAARLIEQIIRSHAGDRRMAVVLFTQGRIDQARGRFRAAARAFGRCRSRFPGGSLAEDALAEQANALRAAGSKEQASAAARRYLSRYPGGIHRRRMREILRR